LTRKAIAAVTVYKGEGVQKGVGRFGPFIKWNGLFINVIRYDFDNLSRGY
jgi:DNA topoisomerase-1